MLACLLDRDAHEVSRAQTGAVEDSDHPVDLWRIGAAAAVGSWRLDGATVVVTLEPCPMCAGAIQQARVERVVFGAADMKAGACGSLYHLGQDPRLNHEFVTTQGVRAEECAALLSDFFAARR